MNEERSKDERRTILSDCWADCDAVSLLMVFQELIKFDFGTFFLDDDLYNTLHNLRHIKILLPKTEQNLHEKLPRITPRFKNVPICFTLFVLIANSLFYFSRKLKKNLQKVAPYYMSP